eukprot:CAMPEP_0194215928 /NCGR_PEP_ID=MMETSP0156-20130528/18059_1 /TAXON_ID=33649 /ORGANISM="Thalassionema nitzschioides, Strain L26-B" /LENGTH=162 /DNA_ID=CAMNT_0038944573 /DNA_START=89 /DNA_END=577 /DNA_ORIENTATION=+
MDPLLDSFSNIYEQFLISPVTSLELPADAITLSRISPSDQPEQQQECNFSVLVEQVPENAIQEWDILPGRGGHANNYGGNKRFRQVVEQMKPAYKNYTRKTDKTALSNAIVDYVNQYSGRFLTRLGANPGYYRVMTLKECRRKTSQALRETKKLKWKLETPL